MCLNHDQPCRICRLESIVVSYPSERHTHHKARRILGHLRCLGFWYILIIPEHTQPQLRCQAIVLELERLRKISENIVQDHQDRSWANWTMSSLMKSIFNRHCSNLLPLAVGNWLPWGCWTEMLSFEWAASTNFRKRLGRPKSFVGPAWRKKTTKASLEPWPCLWSFSRYWFQFEKAWNLGKPWLWPLAGAMPLGWTFYIYDIYGLWPYDSPIGFNWRPEKSRRTWWDQKAAEWFSSFGSRNFGAMTSRRVLLCLEGLCP